MDDKLPQLIGRTEFLAEGVGRACGVIEEDVRMRCIGVSGRR